MNSKITFQSKLLMVGYQWLPLIACFPFAASTGCGEDTSAAQVSAVEQDATEAEVAANEPKGLELGNFKIEELQPANGKKSILLFQVYANVRTEDFKKASQTLAIHQHAIRDQIITAARIAALEEFDDPHLLKLRQRIQLRLRRSMPNLAIQEILITNFRFSMESV